MLEPGVDNGALVPHGAVWCARQALTRRSAAALYDEALRRSVHEARMHLHTKHYIIRTICIQSAT